MFGQLGRTEDSVSAYDQVISDRTRLLGEGHAETLDTRHSQLKALVIAGQFERALPSLKRLLYDREDAQGADHPDTLETRKHHSVALALAQPDDRALRDAVGDLEEILHIQEKRLGPDHPMSRDTAECRGRASMSRPTTTANRPSGCCLPYPPLPKTMRRPSALNPISEPRPTPSAAWPWSAGSSGSRNAQPSSPPGTTDSEV